MGVTQRRGGVRSALHLLADGFPPLTCLSIQWRAFFLMVVPSRTKPCVPSGYSKESNVNSRGTNSGKPSCDLPQFHELCDKETEAD